MARLNLALRLALAVLLWSGVCLAAETSSPPSIIVGDTDGLGVERAFLQLEPLSADTRRRQITTLDAPVDLDSFTRLRRVKSNGRDAYSNATLIAGGDCYWIASVAGHSVLDQRYSRLANRGDIFVEVPGGKWLNPEEIVTSERLNWNSGELDDWALLVLRAPRCAFDDSKRFQQTLPHFPTHALQADQLEACRNRVQMLCYHFDQGLAEGQRMLEEDCQLLSIRREAGSTGYTSCKVDYGVSGCAPVCLQGDLWLNLGVFSKGLKRHGVASYPQPVAAFRLVDGEFADALAALKQKYALP